MKRLRIVVSGRVQRVGYRDAVAELGRRLGITGTVQNLDDDVSVEIIGEGEDRQLNDFVKRINIKDNAVEVEKLDVHEEKASGKYKHFKIIRGEPNEELGERMDVAGALLYKMLEKQDMTINKLDSMNRNLGGKIDTTNAKLDSFSAATTGRFDVVDTKYGKISERLEETNLYLKELVDVLKEFKPKKD